MGEHLGRMVWALIIMGTCVLGSFTIYFKPGRKEHYMLLVALVHGLLVVLSIVELIYAIIFSDSFLAWKVRQFPSAVTHFLTFCR